MSKEVGDMTGREIVVRVYGMVARMSVREEDPGVAAGMWGEVVRVCDLVLKDGEDEVVRGYRDGAERRRFENQSDWDWLRSSSIEER